MFVSITNSKVDLTGPIQNRLVSQVDSKFDLLTLGPECVHKPELELITQADGCAAIFVGRVINPFVATRQS